jgi:coenzyme Q-binding protein COQ10
VYPVPFAFHETRQTVYLAAVEQQLAQSFRVGRHVCRHGVERRHVRAQQPRFAFAQDHVAVRELSFSGAHALDFPALEGNAGLEAILDEVVETRLPILRNRRRCIVGLLGHARAMILESPGKKHVAIPKERDLPQVKRSARVAYTPEQMFDLVNDIERYPEFLEWCKGARIDARHGATIEATLDIGFFGFQQSFRTRNSLRRPERIGIDLVSGPFRRLRGEWRFSRVEGGTDISLSLTFEVTLSPFGAVFAKVFEELAASQMNAFIARAAAVYDRPS